MSDDESPAQSAPFRRKVYVAAGVVERFGRERVNDEIPNVAYGAKECCVCREEIVEQDPAVLILYQRTLYLRTWEQPQVWDRDGIRALLHHDGCRDGARLTLRMIGAEIKATGDSALVSARCGAGSQHCHVEVGRVSYSDGSYWWIGVEARTLDADDGAGLPMTGRRQRRHQAEKRVGWDHDQRADVCFGYSGVAVELSPAVETVSGWCETHQRQRPFVVSTVLIPAATLAKNRGKMRTLTAQR